MIGYDHKMIVYDHKTSYRPLWDPVGPFGTQKYFLDES